MLRSNLCLAAGVLALTGIAQAGTVIDLTFYPYQAGGIVVGDTTKSGPGFGDSSWQNGATSGSTKAEFYLPAAQLFGFAPTIAQIDSISYMTDNPTADIYNWSLNLYTNPQGALTGDVATWYRSHLVAEPYFVANYTGVEAENTWATWSTNDPNQPLKFYDNTRMGTGALNSYYGAYTDPTFSAYQSGPVKVANGGTWDYTNETVKYFSLQVGSAWAAGYRGNLDGLVIKLKDGTQANINFEAVPEPSPFVLSLLPLSLWLFLKKR